MTLARPSEVDQADHRQNRGSFPQSSCHQGAGTVIER